MTETNSPFLTAVDRVVKGDAQCREAWAEMNGSTTLETTKGHSRPSIDTARRGCLKNGR